MVSETRQEPKKPQEAHQPMTEAKKELMPSKNGCTDGDEEEFDTRRASGAIVATIGRRLAEARGLTGWTQTEAATRLGVTPRKLSDMENPADRLNIPLALLRRAAEAYEVSLDFLFGASDDWEVGARMTQERRVSTWLFREFDRARLEQMEMLRRLHERIECIGQIVATVSAAHYETGAALERFIELNPVFEDMKAGSRLAGAIERASKTADAARLAFRRFHLDLAGTTETEISLNTEGATA